MGSPPTAERWSCMEPRHWISTPASMTRAGSGGADEVINFGPDPTKRGTALQLGR